MEHDYQHRVLRNMETSEIKPKQIMTWWLESTYVVIEQAKEGFYAIGNADSFRGVVVGDTLDGLYRKLLDGIRLFREITTDTSGD